MGSAAASFGMQTIAAHLRLLPERDPHLGLHRALEMILDHLDEPAVAGALFVRFELALLAELGFGLDLESCAATGESADLIYVSPKSGRAVSRGAGEQWKEQLLPLPRVPDRGPGFGERRRDRRGLRAHRLLPRAAGVRAARAGSSRLAPVAALRAGAGGRGLNGLVRLKSLVYR